MSAEPILVPDRARDALAQFQKYTRRRAEQFFYTTMRLCARACLTRRALENRRMVSKVLMSRQESESRLRREQSRGLFSFFNQRMPETPAA